MEDRSLTASKLSSLEEEELCRKKGGCFAVGGGTSFDIGGGSGREEEEGLEEAKCVSGLDEDFGGRVTRATLEGKGCWVTRMLVSSCSLPGGADLDVSADGSALDIESEWHLLEENGWVVMGSWVRGS